MRYLLAALLLSGCAASPPVIHLAGALIARAAVIDGSTAPSARRVQVAQRIDNPWMDQKAELCAPEMTPECIDYVTAR